MMSELPCVCVCVFVWACEKKQDAGVIQQALHTVRTEDIRAHARAQMLHPLTPTFDTSEEGFCVLPDDGGGGELPRCRTWESHARCTIKTTC